MTSNFATLKLSTEVMQRSAARVNYNTQVHYVILGMVFLDTIISSGVGWLLLILVWGQCEGLKSGMGEKLETPMPFLFPFALSESVLRGSRSRVDSFFGILKRKNPLTRKIEGKIWNFGEKIVSLPPEN